MKQVIVAVLAISFVVAIVGSLRADDVEKGKQIFTDQKCRSCHSVETAGFKKKPNQKVPDLSEVGSKYDAAFLIKFLEKKETIEGRKHMKKFTGSSGDLEALANWLISLKAEAPKEAE